MYVFIHTYNYYNYLLLRNFFFFSGKNLYTNEHVAIKMVRIINDL